MAYDTNSNGKKLKLYKIRDIYGGVYSYRTATKKEAKENFIAENSMNNFDKFVSISKLPPIWFEQKENGDIVFVDVDKRKLKKHSDYGYYLINNDMIHYFDNNKNYETSKILIR